MTGKTLIIGIGNRYRGDDALGCLLVDKLRHALSTQGLSNEFITNNVELIEHDGEPAALIDCWQGYSTAILIDAVASGATAGSLHHIDLQAQALPDQFRSYSTHAFGIREAVELARVLGKLPPRILFYGVEGESFAANTELSGTLKKAAVILQQQIMSEIDSEKKEDNKKGSKHA
jgi:hydrogenase maturation protease